MWKLFERLFGGSAKPGRSGTGSIDAAVKALDDSAAQRALPTLVCRTCGLKYENTGTYLQGAKCPSCFPNG